MTKNQRMFSVFKNINRFAGKYRWLDLLAIFFARSLLYIMLIGFFLFSWTEGNVLVFFYAFTAGVIAAFVLNFFIAKVYYELRPAQVESLQANVLIPVPKNPSFPSNHAALLFGFSIFIFFYYPLLAMVFLVLSIGVGLARVFCGVHWFHDILGGMASGAVSALVVNYLVLLFA